MLRADIGFYFITQYPKRWTSSGSSYKLSAKGGEIVVISYAMINKETLSYICEQRKVSAEYIQKKTHYKVETIEKWLNPAEERFPTIKQAKKLANCLHVPFAGLYMNSKDIPAQKIPPIRNMRTMYGNDSIDEGILGIATMDLLFERDFLVEISAELGIPFPSYSPPYFSKNDPVYWANNIRSTFKLDLGFQYKCPSARQFYLYLRSKIELQGIFIHCFTDVPVEAVRGIAIYDDEIPIIGINADDRPPAKSFSIIHELVHIFRRESTICNEMFNSSSSVQEEIFCNAVAGELLVPEKALAIILENKHIMRPFTMEQLESLAKRFSVSREVIIRRLLDSNRIDITEYGTFLDEFRMELDQQFVEQKANTGNVIPKNIVRTTFDRTSQAICNALYKGYNEEIYSKKDISRHLGIDQKHIDKFLVEVSRWNN